MQLIHKPGKIVSGHITMNNQELLQVKPKQMAHIRGNDIAIIFQEPMTALNPVFTIGSQISEILRKHKNLSKRAANKQTGTLLTTVGMPRAEEMMNEYPHQPSSRMRQRVRSALAM